MIRKARLDDIKRMHTIINGFADQGRMLARSLAELYDGVRDYTVECDGVAEPGTVTGCCALHIVWDSLGEIRSLAVAKECQGRGVATRLVEACLAEATALGVKRVFALTYIPDFFIRLGFEPIDKAELPHKVWSDCMHCPKFPDCDEVAMVMDFK